jgi:multiple sugar transport system substrate-binding protein
LGSLLGRLLSKWVSGLLLCCLPLLLWGCTPQPPQGLATAPLHLTLWQGVNPPSNRDVLQKLIDQFNRSQSEIEIESIYVGQPDQQMPKILAAVAGNAVPDMLWYNPTITGQLVDLNAIRPIDDLWATSSRREQIEPALLETMRYEQQLWSVPFGTNNVGIFYRPSLFKAAGIQQPPQTWSEFRQVAKQLTRDLNGDGRPDQHGIFLALGQGDFAVFTWLPFLWSGGGSLTLPNRPPTLDTANLQNPGAEAALQLWSDLVAEGSAILSAPERGYELDNFLAGKVAMQVTGPWTLGQLQQSGVDFAVFPIPRQTQAAATASPAAAQPATALGGENLFIFKTQPERERAAFKFTEFVASEAFQTDWALNTGYLPVNRRSRDSAAYRQFVAQQPALTVFLEQMAIARSRPLFTGYARVSEQIGRALESVLLQQQTPAQALAQAQQRLDLVK